MVVTLYSGPAGISYCMAIHRVYETVCKFDIFSTAIPDNVVFSPIFVSNKLRLCELECYTYNDKNCLHSTSILLVQLRGESKSCQ